MSEATTLTLSIITVCFNDQDNLAKTLNSIRSQGYKYIQSIIIDGGSKDNTKTLIQSNLDIINYWISEPDAGLYDAMNKGLKQVHGDYVLFLNAGDIFHNTSVVAHAMQSAGGADLLYGDAIIVYEDGSYKSPLHKVTPKSLNWQDFKNGMVVCHQAIFAKPTITATYNIDYKIAADIDWAIRTIRQAKSIQYLSIIICDFQTGGLSSKKRSLALKERWIILEKYFGTWNTIISHFKFLVRRIKLIK